MKLEGKSILAGKTGLTGGATFRAINPANNENLEPEFHEALPDEVDRALHEAAEAFAEFRQRPYEDRARLLDGIATEIEALGDELLDRAHLETGLPLARLQGERARTCGQLRMFAGVVREGSWLDVRIDTALPDRQPLPRPDLRRMLTPLGPVVVFGSSNFPLAFSVAGGDTASALAAGCPVAVKAHRAHPGTAELVGQAIRQAVENCGLPAGLFSLVHGGGATTGVGMVKHSDVAAVGFTGSQLAGRALCDAAASRSNPIPVFAEMSSLNPFVILPGALAGKTEGLVQGLLGSFTLGVGQFCTKPGLVFLLESPETDRFLESFAEAVGQAPCAPMLTPSIHEAFEQNRATVLNVAGVESGGSSSVGETANANEGVPSIAVTSAENFLRHPELATEAFGPFTLIVKGKQLGELIECVCSLEGQLTGTLHGTEQDFEQADSLVSALEQKVGRLIINGYPTGVEVSPAMNHGGPSPATSDPRYTSVGTAAILRFSRPVCYQGFPAAMLPEALQNDNPLGIMRQVNNELTRARIPGS